MSEPGGVGKGGHDGEPVGGDEATLFRMALGAANAVAWAWDVEADDLAWFGDVKRLYGLQTGETHGPSDTFLKLLHPDDQSRVIRAVSDSLVHGADYEVEYRSIRLDGEERWYRTKGTVVTDADGRVTRMLGVATDITDRRASEEKLAHLALHDALTGLPNRALLLDRLALALARRARSGRELAVLFVDLDGFKGVNDRIGHEAGDQVLVTSAARLCAIVRPADTIARLGGDEFVVVAEVRSEDECRDLAQRLVECLSQPHRIDGLEVSCPASAGLRIADDDSTPASLLREADAAMYVAKGAAGDLGGWATAEDTTSMTGP